MSKLIYAGIGSRQTPKDMCYAMTDLARRLAAQGYLLRSGGAAGADKAWEAGANGKEILRPKDATPEAIEVAKSIHPAWHLCDDYVRKLHGRNVMIILGRNLDEPVEFVAAWFDPLIARGGTRLGVELAIKHNIPVDNLASPKEYEAFIEWVDNGNI